MRNLTHKQILSDALVHHKAARFIEAEALYTKVLDTYPASFDALQLLGALCSKLNRFDEAVSYFNKALKLHPDSIVVLNNKGLALSGARKYDEALKTFDFALSITETDVLLYNKGTVLEAMGLLNSAREYYFAAIDANPKYSNAYNNLSVICLNLSEFDDALLFISKAIASDPLNYDFHFNNGVIFDRLNEFSKAATSYKKAIELNRSFSNAYINLANSYVALGEADRALDVYTQAIKTLHQNSDIYNNCANLLKDLGRYDEALVCYENALKLSADKEKILTNIGNLHQETMNFELAERAYKEAMQCSPYFVEAKWNLALMKLLLGDYKDGLSLYESRWQWENFTSPKRNFLSPMWDGDFSKLSGKSVFIHAEQGFGDTIQFSRFINHIERYCSSITFEVQPGLKRLFSNGSILSQKISIIECGASHGYFDMHIPLMSLPFLLNFQILDYFVSKKYIYPRNDSVTLWSQHVSCDSKALKIGIFWKGNPLHWNDAKRSINLSEILPFFPSFCRLHSLQKDLPLDMVKFLEDNNVIYHGNMLSDFYDTASLIANLDLIVTIDSSIAHLAGAMGVKTILMLPYMPDWRWLLNRADTPWYANMLILRQGVDRTWGSVFASLRNLLINYQNKRIN